MDKPTSKKSLKRPADPMQLAKLVRDIATGHVRDEKHSVPTADDIRRVMSALGKRGGQKGGKARAKKLSGTRRSEIAKKAALARWSKLADE